MIVSLSITSPGCIISGLAAHAVKSNANCMVIWTDGRIRTYVQEMYDKPKRLCLWWIREHKHEPRFAGGKLLAVSMMEKRTN